MRQEATPGFREGGEPEGGNNRWNELSAYEHLDAIVLTSVLSFYFLVRGTDMVSPKSFSPLVISMTLVLIGAYWILSIWHTWIFGPGRQDRQARWKWIVLLLLLTTLIGIPMITTMVERQRTAPEKLIHDGALQVEAAGRFFIAGKNPYVEDYTETPMIRWNATSLEPASLEPASNPTLFHYVYLPLTFIVSGLADALLRPVLGWYDIRLLFAGALISAVILIRRLTVGLQRRALLLIALVFNPLTMLYIIEGRNDIVITMLMLLTIFLLQQRRPHLAVFVLALSCSLKQTAWFATPYILLFIGGEGTLSERVKRILWPGAVFGITFCVLVLPWVAMNPAAFFQDTFSYLSGRIPTSYPIDGIGFAKLILSVGAVKTSHDYFPFSYFQLGFGLPALIYTLYRQWKVNTVSNAIVFSALLLFMFGFFTRTFSESYLGYLVGQLFIGTLLEAPSSSQEQPLLESWKLELLVTTLLIAQVIQATQWTYLVTSVLLGYWVISLLAVEWLNVKRRRLILFGLIALMFSITWLSWIMALFPVLNSRPQQAGIAALLEGQSPYSNSSAGSLSGFSDLPGNLLIYVPVSMLMKAFGLQNASIYANLIGVMILGIVIGTAGSLLTSNITYRIAMWGGIVFSPLLIPPTILGESIALAVAMIFLAVLFLWKRRDILVAIALATGCVTHGWVWLLVPFAGVWLYRREGATHRIWLAAIVFIGIVLGVMLPFFRSDPAGMVSSILVTPLRSQGPNSFADRINDFEPFLMIVFQNVSWLLALVLVGGLLIAFLRTRQNKLSSVMMHYTLLILVFRLFTPAFLSALDGLVLFCGIVTLVLNAMERTSITDDSSQLPTVDVIQ